MVQSKNNVFLGFLKTYWFLIIFCLQAEYFITRAIYRIELLEQHDLQNSNYHKSFMNCFYDLGCNPLEYLEGTMDTRCSKVDYSNNTPQLDSCVQSKEQKLSFYPAKHEEFLTIDNITE